MLLNDNQIKNIINKKLLSNLNSLFIDISNLPTDKKALLIKGLPVLFNQFKKIIHNSYDRKLSLGIAKVDNLSIFLSFENAHLFKEILEHTNNTFIHSLLEEYESIENIPIYPSLPNVSNKENLLLQLECNPNVHQEDINAIVNEFSNIYYENLRLNISKTLNYLISKYTFEEFSNVYNQVFKSLNKNPYETMNHYFSEQID